VKQVVVRPAAAADIEAYEWYESQQPGLGDEFLAALRTTRDRLLEHPEAYPVLHRNTRRALHWADPSTRELVDFIFGQVPAASILMLMTSRPEFRPPWGHRGHFTYLTLAETYREGGRIDEALQAVAEGLKQAQATSARFNEAELYRLKGELLLMSAGPGAEEAERCFRQAVEIARRQSAKSLELRAAMSLSRLLHRQGKREDARRLLAEIYAWFTEGFDTADLKDARALLDALATGPEVK